MYPFSSVCMIFCIVHFVIECILRNTYYENVEVYKLDISVSPLKNRGYSIQ